MGILTSGYDSPFVFYLYTHFIYLYTHIAFGKQLQTGYKENRPGKPYSLIVHEP